MRTHSDENVIIPATHVWDRLAYIAVLLLGITIGGIAYPIYSIGEYFITGRVIQTLESHETKHSAQLIRFFGVADYNLGVKVDGRDVYRSGDMVGFKDHTLRETLLWDKTGKVVLLEMMGRRVFAYDAEKRRGLSASELDGYEFYPSLNDRSFDYLNVLDR